MLGASSYRGFDRKPLDLWSVLDELLVALQMVHVHNTVQMIYLVLQGLGEQAVRVSRTIRSSPSRPAALTQIDLVMTAEYPGTLRHPSTTSL